METETKVPKGRRRPHVRVTPRLEAMLRELARKQRREDPWGRAGETDFVFRSPEGSPMDKRNTQRAWERLRRRFGEAGIRRLPLHSWRHTFATLALEGGKSIRWVSEALGHANPELTLRTYAHVLPDEDDSLDFLAESA